MAKAKPTPGARRGGSRAELMMQVRRWHSYLGALIAPALLMFAITGGFQLFGLHESHGDYRPQPLLEKFGQLHMKQTFSAKASRPAAGGAPAKGAVQAGAAPKPAAAKTVTPFKIQALKWFFLLVSAGLTISTLLGVWLALTFSRNKPVIWGLLVAGTLLPVLLVLL
jgi:hypothetical protein